jgi:hypothetical protein
MTVSAPFCSRSLKLLRSSTACQWYSTSQVVGETFATVAVLVFREATMSRVGVAQAVSGWRQAWGRTPAGRWRSENPTAANCLT